MSESNPGTMMTLIGSSHDADRTGSNRHHGGFPATGLQHSALEGRTNATAIQANNTNFISSRAADIQ